MSNSDENKFNDLAASTGTITGAELQRYEDSANRNATTANVFYVSGAVISAVGLVWWAFWD